MRRLSVLFLVIVAFVLQPVHVAGQMPDKAAHCKVAKLASPPKIDANWDKAPWKDIQAERLRWHMGSKPEHFPTADVKIAHDDDALYLIFRVEDRYVRAVTAKYQGPVWTDSCVEFFFSPGTDVSQGYFNLEMNCGGTALLCFHRTPRTGIVQIPESEYRKLTVAHSLPKIVDPEIETPIIWTVEYRLPVEILKKYCPTAMPASGAAWRANFYKCADKSSRPHWLTWSPVKFPEPKFHSPEFFGTLTFE